MLQVAGAGRQPKSRPIAGDFNVRPPSNPNNADGKIAEPQAAHVTALKAAGRPHVILHGLLRSFGTLSKWCEVRIGVVAQIQGQKSSSIVEKHYRRRPLDLRRKWHDQIET